MAEPAAPRRARITVLAGVNGAGKSSIAGAMLRQSQGEYFNPDEEARRIRLKAPALSPAEANAQAWQKGKSFLEKAIAEGKDFAFETTLGGKSITDLMIEAVTQDRAELWVWYAGLESPELHLKRVSERVAKGGHDIPESDIRRRYETSHLNLIRLLPFLAKLSVYDNSREADPAQGARPEPQPVLVFDSRGISFPDTARLKATPAWAKPIVMAAIKNFGGVLPR